MYRRSSTESACGAIWPGAGIGMREPSTTTVRCNVSLTIVEASLNAVFRDGSTSELASDMAPDAGLAAVLAAVLASAAAPALAPATALATDRALIRSTAITDCRAGRIPRWHSNASSRRPCASRMRPSRCRLWTQPGAATIASVASSVASSSASCSSDRAACAACRFASERCSRKVVPDNLPGRPCNVCRSRRTLRGTGKAADIETRLAPSGTISRACSVPADRLMARSGVRHALVVAPLAPLESSRDSFRSMGALVDISAIRERCSLWNERSLPIRFRTAGAR